MKHARPTVLYAAAVRDAAGVNASPGAVLVQDGQVIAAGEPESLPAELVEQAEVIERRSDLLMPAMVNAHTHLELTHIGPQPYDPEGGFVGWVKMLWKNEQRDVARIFNTIQQGASACLAGGIQSVGNIAIPSDADKNINLLGLSGVTYRELFGIGAPFNEPSLWMVEKLDQGLQPHAPYSAGPELYEAVARSGKPVATHLAETKDELDFVSKLAGPKFDFIRSIERWRDEFKAFYGHGLSPVQWMRSYLETAANDGGWLVAHCNYVSDDDIAILADTNTSVAYCPIASEYFGHKDHRYRDMLNAGINVCLGTDSIVGTDPDDPQPLGLLSAMRRLYQRDQADPETLMAMATVNGARALRLDDKVATLKPGAPARFACVRIDPHSPTDPLVQVLTGQNQVEAISFGLPA